MIKKLIKLLVLALVFCSCINGDKDQPKISNKQISQTSKPVTKVKLIGLWYNQGERETLLKDFIRQYNFKHQESEIEVTFSEQIEGFMANHEKFINEQVHKQQADYDIIILNNCYHFSLNGEKNWIKKYFVDFSQISGFKEQTLPGLINDSIKNLWHGIIPGPFVEGFSYTLWCNRNVAKKIGVEVKQIGMTYDDFLGYIKALNNYNNSHPNDYIIPIMEGGKNWKTLSRFFEQLYASALNDNVEYLKDYLSEKKLIAWHKTLLALEKLSIHKPLSSEWKSMDWNESIPLMLNDKCFFYSNGSWMYNQFEDNNENDNLKNLMPTEFPVLNPVQTYPIGYQISWGVPKNAPNKDLAINFLMEMNKPLFAEDWVRKTKSPTGIKGSLTNIAIGLDQFENYMFNINKKYSNNAFIANGNQTIFSTAYKSENSYAHNVLAGELTADEAIIKIRENFARKGVEIINNLN